jgi:hypothetical protein
MKANAIHGLLTGILCASYYLICSTKPQSKIQRIRNAVIMTTIGLISGATIMITIPE